MKLAMNFKFLGKIVSIALFSVFSQLAVAAAVDGCIDSIKVKPAKTPWLSTDGLVARQLSPGFFGFNLEWLQFELGFWDIPNKKINAELADYLQPFAGATYRYPGGMGANYFKWEDAQGAIESRPINKDEDWLEPRPIYFGPAEYMDFIRQVKGTSWYVANLYGSRQGEVSTTSLSASSGNLANLIDKNGEIYRWELGNELDRSEHHWKPQKIAERALAVANSVRQKQSAAQFVIALEEYPAMHKYGYDTEEFNRELIHATKQTVKEHAIHHYYDDKPDGITVEKQLTATCRAIEDITSEGIVPKIWISEHGFVPKGAWETADWKYLWPETSGYKAAINVADMMIAAAQVPQIQGLMIHDLHGSGGPWPMFTKTSDGHFIATPVFQMLTLLRKSMLPLVLKTQSFSNHESSYNGGYDVRGLLMTNNDKSQISAWIVNRKSVATELVITLPPSISGAINIKLNTLRMDNTAKQQNGAKLSSMTLNYQLGKSQPSIKVRVEPYSVSTIESVPSSND